MRKSASAVSAPSTVSLTAILSRPGPHARSRLSALKAQKSIAPRTAKADALDPTAKTIRAIKRNRKQRHAKLKEMLSEDEDDDWRKGLVGGQMDCPICSQNVRGDQGVLEAHVDACVTNEELRLAEQAQQEALQRQYDEEARWEESNSNYVGDLRGAPQFTIPLSLSSLLRRRWFPYA